MRSILEPSELLRRIEIYVEEEVRAERLPKGTFPLLREGLLAGEFERGNADTITGYGERMARKGIVRSFQKTNILIALTPYVITDQSDLRRVLEKKLKERREFVERFGAQDVVNPEAAIDYRRKRGMLEEINRAAKELEDEEAEMQHIRERDAQEEAGVVDVPVNLRSPSSGPSYPGASPPAPGAAPTTPPPRGTSPATRPSAASPPAAPTPPAPATPPAPPEPSPPPPPSP